jgi:hypothetical protein
LVLMDWAMEVLLRESTIPGPKPAYLFGEPILREVKARQDGEKRP